MNTFAGSFVNCSKMAEDSMAAEYSEMTDTQERLMIIDIYIISTIGATLSILMLYSLIKKKSTSYPKSTDKYYQYAINSAIISCAAALTTYLVKIIFSTDLVFAINYSANIEIATTIDAFICLFSAIEKIAFYFGFAFIYSSIYSPQSMDYGLIIMMVIFAVATSGYTLFYFVADLWTSNLDEISVGAKRGIHAVLPFGSDDSSTAVMISGGVGMFADGVMTCVLIYKYFSQNNGRKGAILLCISFLFWVVFGVINMADIDMKYVYFSIIWIVDTVCLYSMFDDTKYEMVEVIDVDEDTEINEQDV